MFMTITLSEQVCARARSHTHTHVRTHRHTHARARARRSMLATIALGAAQSPVGVAAGAIVGHAIATGIAVLGGAIASKYVSEKTINISSGVLFLLFAAATAYTMF